MARMRAIVHDPTSKRGLRLGEAPAPTTHAALVRVHSISLNFGEVAFLARMRKPGEVPGWDAAGIVTKAAESGPRVGARVVTFGWSGAWAEERAVDPSNMAEIPDGVDFAAASALPVAGVTALRALRALGPVLGRRVLVTGASGGVGRFALQLAKRAGAHVIALTGRDAPLPGADETVHSLDAIEPVFGVLDNVGGSVLARAFSKVEAGGSLQSIGAASLEPTTIDFEAERLRGGDRRVSVFTVGDRFAADMAFLLACVAKGELDPNIGYRADWSNVSEAADALLDRRIAGKAVLEVR